MFALIKNNIIKVVEDENSRDKLISKGFKIYSEEVTKENIEKKKKKLNQPLMIYLIYLNQSLWKLLKARI